MNGQSAAMRTLGGRLGAAPSLRHDVYGVARIDQCIHHVPDIRADAAGWCWRILTRDEQVNHVIALYARQNDPRPTAQAQAPGCAEGRRGTAGAPGEDH